MEQKPQDAQPGLNAQQASIAIPIALPVSVAAGSSSDESKRVIVPTVVQTADGKVTLTLVLKYPEPAAAPLARPSASRKKSASSASSAQSKASASSSLSDASNHDNSKPAARNRKHRPHGYQAHPIPDTDRQLRLPIIVTIDLRCARTPFYLALTRVQRKQRKHLLCDIDCSFLGSELPHFWKRTELPEADRCLLLEAWMKNRVPETQQFRSIADALAHNLPQARANQFCNAHLRCRVVQPEHVVETCSLRDYLDLKTGAQFVDRVVFDTRDAAAVQRVDHLIQSHKLFADFPPTSSHAVPHADDQVDAAMSSVSGAAPHVPASATALAAAPVAAVAAVAAASGNVNTGKGKRVLAEPLPSRSQRKKRRL